MTVESRIEKVVICIAMKENEKSRADSDTDKYSVNSVYVNKA